jgi:predicted dehydrogenase
VGIGAFATDLDDVLADPSIDAVEILTPTYLHSSHVLAALAAGKHVSCQQPLANSVDEARTMADAARATGLTLRVSECFRHYPPLVRAKELVEFGAIGRLTNLRIRTVVGQTDSAFQAGLQADGHLEAQSPEPRWTPVRRHDPQVRHGLVAGRTGSHIGPSGGAPS